MARYTREIVIQDVGAPTLKMGRFTHSKNTVFLGGYTHPIGPAKHEYFLDFKFE